MCHAHIGGHSCVQQQQRQQPCQGSQSIQQRGHSSPSHSCCSCSQVMLILLSVFVSSHAHHRWAFLCPAAAEVAAYKYPRERAHQTVWPAAWPCLLQKNCHLWKGFHATGACVQDCVCVCARAYMFACAIIQCGQQPGHVSRERSCRLWKGFHAIGACTC